MHRKARLALAALHLCCIQAPELRAPPSPLRLLTVESPTGDLDALSRVAALTLRFDRPLAWPAENSVMFVTGALTDALRSDAADGRLTSTYAPRLVPVRLSLDPRDSSTLRLEASVALLPDTPAALLVSTLVRGSDGALLEAPDAGPRGAAVTVTVAPARRCGALARVEPVTPGEEPLNTARVHVRFDRPVRVSRSESPFALATDAGRRVSSRSALDCLDADGMARCGWVEPAAALEPLTVYRVATGPLTAGNGARAEVAASAFVTGMRRDAPRVTFGVAPVCAPDESPSGSFCLRTNDRWIELRASTTGAAIVRLGASAMTPSAPRHVALGPAGSVHTLRVYVPHAATAYALTVECLSSDGRVHDARRIALVTTTQALPRVRITEVLARPRSTSAQEYVELMNDGRSPANLSGFLLVQGASRSALPDGSVLAPGARAVVVGASFDPRGVPTQGDPPVAPGTTLFVLRAGVAGRGLRDAGADVALTDPEGRLLSLMPGSAPSRAPRAGVSIVRAANDLADEDPAAWTYDAMEGCTPGAQDRIR